MDEAFERTTEQFVLLCEPESDRQRDLILEMLKDQNIPAFSRDNGAGSYVRILTGGSVFGSKVFVPVSCQAQAVHLWNSVSRQDQPEFSNMELNAAYEEYMRSHAVPAEDEDAADESEDGENGYRMMKFFLLGFGTLFLAALILLAVK